MQLNERSTHLENLLTIQCGLPGSRALSCRKP